MDDEAIVASLDRDPEAFADFYRRHAGQLLSDFAARTNNARLAAELLAETFAATLARAHRFDPERGPAAAWLEAIAEAELAYAERAGAARARARRRLGLAALELGDRFVDELEEELVEAARFRASRRRQGPRRRLPRSPRQPPRAATSGPSAQLVVMLPPQRCLTRTFDERPASPAIPYFRVFDYRPRIDDELGRDLAESLPVASYDPRETKLAANGRRGTRLHLVRSLGVSEDRSCAADDGPGVCLVQEDAGRFRCFGIERIRDGLAFARTERNSIVGIVPDGIG